MEWLCFVCNQSDALILVDGKKSQSVMLRLLFLIISNTTLGLDPASVTLLAVTNNINNPKFISTIRHPFKYSLTVRLAIEVRCALTCRTDNANVLSIYDFWAVWKVPTTAIFCSFLEFFFAEGGRMCSSSNPWRNICTDSFKINSSVKPFIRNSKARCLSQ